jgi:hypothetical protein
LSKIYKAEAATCPSGRCPGSDKPRLRKKSANVVLKALIAEVPVHCPNGLRFGAHDLAEADPEGCPFTGTSAEVDAHFDSCPFKLEMCTCGAELRPSEKAAHKGECADVLVRCPFAGCGAMHNRGNAAAHEMEAAVHHARSEREERQRLQSLLAAGGEFEKAAHAEIKQATASKDSARIMTIMDTFRQNEDIVRRACAALATICGCAEEQVKADEAGAVVAVVDAMKLHAGSAVVQVEAITALYRITANNADNTARAGSANRLFQLRSNRLIDIDICENEMHVVNGK